MYYYRILIQDIYTGNSMLVIYKVIILCILIIEKRKNIYIYIYIYKYEDRIVEERVVYSLRQETCKITVVK